MDLILSKVDMRKVFSNDETELIKLRNALMASPEYCELLGDSIMARVSNRDKLDALIKSNTEKRTDNTALFEAVDFRDDTLKPLENRIEELRKSVTTPLNTLKMIVQRLFVSGKNDKPLEFEELKSFRLALDKAIVEYQKREIPNEKTIRTGNAQVTIRTDRVLVIKDKEKFIKACVSTAKANEGLSIDLLEINETALKALMKDENVKISNKLVEWKYKETVV